MFKATSRCYLPMARFFCIAVIASATAYGQGRDPKAVDMLEKLQARYEASIEGIDDYIVIGEQHAVYHKKTHDNDRPYFKTRTELKGMRGAESATVTDADFFSRVYSEVKENATYEGADEVDGHRVEVLHVERLEGVMDGEGVGDTLEDLRLYIDPEQWVLRQMRYTVEFTSEDGEVRQISPVIQQKDFRDVQGMLIPYETSMIVRGMALSDAERRQAVEGLKQLETQLEAMPEAQRRMVEQMLGDQLDRFKKMIEEDQIEMTSRVEEVRVNTGMEDW